MPKHSVIWTNEAFDDLLLIEDFIGFNKAQKTIDKIIARVRQLEDFPLSGRIQPTQTKQEYRFLVEGNYKIIYSYRTGKVYINTIFDTRQDPDKLKV
ncbi:MAG: type II toxin-antitoxin system RelE/ParE family toxin [Emticicia sp.]|uniref:type II toxin-antitoxin system RelE/ParE family toxin n=1 Tax=Emticicia sp. TaxID=1930953 RepID=UPI003BA62597